ncbi:MAG: 4-fold beta flower protein [Candidatus Competibacter sp.]
MEAYDFEFLNSDQETCTVVFKWTGVYAGFFKNDRLFDRSGRYLGWRDAQGSVWKYDGEWLGRVVEQNYLVRDLRALPQRRPPQVSSLSALPPMPPAPRVARAVWPSSCDPLEALLRMPLPDELIGEWCADDESLRFSEDGSFQWTGMEPAMDAIGCWELCGQELRLRWEGAEEPERTYWVIEFSGDSLLLRWMRKTGRSLPFWLHRRAAQLDNQSAADESQAT